MIAQLTEGFFLGIATGTMCLATCGPIYVPYLMLSERTLKSSLLTILEISGGRFIAYLVVGLLAGLLSKNLDMFGDKLWLTAIAYLLFSTYLIFSALRTQRRKPCCNRAKWYSFVDRPIILGLLTGINFCPSFLLAFTRAVNLSGPLAGMALFGAFFVGTSLYLLPLSFFGVFGKQSVLRRFAQVSACGVGLWFIVQAVLIINGLVVEKPQTAADENDIINIMDSIPAYIVTSDTIRLKALQKALSSERKGTVTIVQNTDRLPDRCYVFTSPSLGDSSHPHQNPLRKPGRFVLFLPGSFLDSASEGNARNMVKFLSRYSFKIDPDSGSVYRIPPHILL
jgi:sulfite exporter TauE/SafE